MKTKIAKIICLMGICISMMTGCSSTSSDLTNIPDVSDAMFNRISASIEAQMAGINNSLVQQSSSK